MDGSYRILAQTPAPDVYRRTCEAVGWSSIMDFEAATVALFRSNCDTSAALVRGGHPVTACLDCGLPRTTRHRVVGFITTHPDDLGVEGQ